MNIVALRLRRISIATVAVCLAIIAAYNLIPRTEAESAAALPPMLAATKTASLAGGDVDGDGLADPGDTITYTVTVQNNAAVGAGNDATGVVITDTLQNITTLVGMSVNAQPIAANESFSVTGNVSISVPDGVSDLLANDFDPDTGSGAALTMVSTNVTSTNCVVATCPANNVVISANGSFTYNPPPGFEGADTFTYTIRDNGPDGVPANADDATATGTVTLNISGMVWFINNGAAACTTLAAGCGRLSNPFSTLAAFQALNNGTGNNPAANDNIFIFESANPYLLGVILLAGQKLIGQDSTSTLAAITGITLPTFSTAFPLMNTGAPATTIQNAGAGGNGVTLGAGNTLNGFTASNSTLSAIIGSAFGTLTVNNVIINTTGQALSLTNGTFAGAGFSSITSTGGAAGISLTTLSGTFTVPTVSINGQTGDGITITSSPGTVNINGGSIGNTDDPAGNAVEVNGSNGNVAIAATLTKISAGKIVLVTARTGNTVALSGNISATGAVDNGIDVNTNTAGIVNFTGPTQTLTTGASSAVNLFTNGTGSINFVPAAGGNGLDITTTSGLGFRAETGGTVTVQGAGHTISTGTGTALTVVNATIGAPDMTFQSISSNGAASGVVLTTTGAIGGLTVTGNAGTCSSAATCTGGAIQNSTGPGINLTSVGGGVSLTRMSVNNGGDDGIRGASVVGFALDNSRVITNGNAVNESGVDFIGGLTGTASISNSTVDGYAENGVIVTNASGSLNLTVTASTFINASAATGNDGIHLDANDTAAITASVTGSTFNNNRGDHFQFSTNASSSGANSVTYSSNTLTGDRGAGFGGNDLGAGITISTGGSSDTTFTVANNNIQGSVFPTIGIDVGTTSTAGYTLSGTVSGNTIGNAAVAASGGAQSSGIAAIGQGTGTLTVAITNNTIRQNNGFAGIDILSRDGSPTINATVTGNSIANPAAGGGNGLLLRNGAITTDGGFTCAAITGNSLAGSAVAGLDDFRLRQRFNTTVRLPGYGGAAGDTAAVVAFVQGNNPGVETGSATAAFPATGGGFVGGAACTLPSFASLANEEIPSNNAEANGPATMSPSSFALVSQDFDPTRLIPDHKESVGLAVSANTDAFHSEDLAAVVSQIADTFLKGAELGYAALGAVTEMISPTVYSQEKKEAAGPEAGETITINGGGAGFTLPAQKTIVVTFKATVNAGPFLSGVNNITNTASVTSTNHAPVSTNTTSLVLDAAPDLQVTVSDGGTTTQPGGVISYTTTYQNNTAVNGQNAAAVRVTQTVPTNTTFNATVSGGGWSCPDGSAGGTVCTFDVGAVDAGATPAAINFAVNVLPLLPAGAIQISDTATIAENPVNANGTDRVPANNTSTDTTNIIGNWLGTTAVWETPSNWSNGILPPAGNNISLPTGTTAPVLSSSPTVGMLTLGTNITINAGFTLSATGNVALGANNVLGAGTLSLGTASAITRTTGQVNATLQKNFAGPGPLFRMPVGTTGEFTPLDVTVTAGTGQLTVRATDTFQPGLATISGRVLQRYWTLSGSGITSNLTFNYLTADVPGAPNNENIWQVIRVTGTTIVRYPPSPTVIMNPGANTFTVNGVASYSDWTAGEPLAPTAAQVGVSGRVMTGDGRGVSGARVALTNQSGHIVYAITNPFGYYRFVGVESGQTYLASVADKRHVFASRSVSVNDEVVGFDFLPEP